MDVGLHGRARIAEAISVLTLPPETTATTVSPLDLPGEHRRRSRPRRPARTRASRARRGSGTPSAISSSVTSTTSTPSARQIAIASRPANGAVSASATVCGVTGTGSPAARPSASAFECSGSTATTRTPARHARRRDARRPGRRRRRRRRSCRRRARPRGSRARPCPRPRSRPGRRRDARSTRPVCATSSCRRSKAPRRALGLEVDRRAVAARRLDLGACSRPATSRAARRCPRPPPPRRPPARGCRPRR